MGFEQDPAFNTVTNQPTFGVPSFQSTVSKHLLAQEAKDDEASESDQTNETTPEKTLATTTTDISDVANLPTSPIVDASIYNNSDSVAVTTGDVWDYIWQRSQYSFQLYATGHPVFTGIRTEIATIGRHDPFLQLLSWVNLAPWRDTFVISLSLPHIEPFFYGVFLQQSDTTQAADASVPGIKMHAAQLRDNLKYTVLTDVEELLEGNSTHALTFPSKLSQINPIAKFLPFFTELSQHTKDVFSFQSLHISDLADGIRVIDVSNTDLSQLDMQEYATQESDALIQIVVHFNQNNIPTSSQRDVDPFNQIFVNAWMNQIYLHLAQIGHAVSQFHLPTSIYKRVMLAREKTAALAEEEEEGPQRSKTTKPSVVSAAKKSHSKKLD